MSELSLDLMRPAVRYGMLPASSVTRSFLRRWKRPRSRSNETVSPIIIVSRNQSSSQSPQLFSLLHCISRTVYKIHCKCVDKSTKIGQPKQLVLWTHPSLRVCIVYAKSHSTVLLIPKLCPNIRSAPRSAIDNESR